MIVEERMVAFINSLDKGNTVFLDEIEKEARAQQVPVIRKETQSLLKFLMALVQPKHILEVGTATGFSAGQRKFPQSRKRAGHYPACRGCRKYSEGAGRGL